MNEEQALNPIKLPPADLIVTDRIDEAGNCHERRFFNASTLAAAIHKDRDEQAAKWEAAMRADREATVLALQHEGRDGIGERDEEISTLKALVEMLRDEVQQLRERPAAATPGFIITTGPQAAWLNVRTGTLFALGELAATPRNQHLIDSGEIVRLFRGGCNVEVQP